MLEIDMYGDEGEKLRAGRNSAVIVIFHAGFIDWIELVLL